MPAANGPALCAVRTAETLFLSRRVAGDTSSMCVIKDSHKSNF